MRTTFQPENLRARRHLLQLGAGRRIILKFSLRKECMMFGLGSAGYG
jgi:hypothetical protein